MAEEESLLTQEEMEAIGLEPDQVSCARIFTLLRSPRIDSKESFRQPM
jgi:hypothetical protein